TWNQARTIFFSSRRRHTRLQGDWSSDVCSSDLERLDRDVKLGRGGIREIEFIVQTLQLIHGARHPFLQEPSMLKALYALRQLDRSEERRVGKECRCGEWL